MVWMADPAGAVDDMPVWRDITGQPRDAVRGLGWIEAVHPEDRDLVAPDGGGDRLRADLRGGLPLAAARRATSLVPRPCGSHSRRRSDRRVGRRVRRHPRGARRNRAPSRGRACTRRPGLFARLRVDARPPLTRLMVPALADYCSVDLVDHEGRHPPRRDDARGPGEGRAGPPALGEVSVPRRPTASVSRGRANGPHAGDPSIDPAETARFARNPTRRAPRRARRPLVHLRSISARGHVLARSRWSSPIQGASTSTRTSARRRTSPRVPRRRSTMRASMPTRRRRIAPRASSSRR